MIESTSQTFLDIVDPAKDKLYDLARMAAPNQTEICLQRCAREVFQLFHHQDIGPADIITHIEVRIRASQTRPDDTTADAAPMPAAVWARLVAAVQIDAARLGGVTEQSMLHYDPLLAPQKKKINDDSSEGLNLSPWSRFVVAAAIVLTVGIAASLILTTRHSRSTKGSKSAVTAKPHLPSKVSPAKSPKRKTTAEPTTRAVGKASPPS